MTRATFLNTVNVRSSPSVSSSIVAQYYPGETVVYDQIVKAEGRTWISYIGGSGNRRYCCQIDTDGSHYISLGGSSSSSPSPPSSTGGIPFYQRDSSYSAVRAEGCLFCASCWIAGLRSIKQVDTAFEWASSVGKVRASDSYVNMSAGQLAREISQHYGTDYTPDCDIRHGNNHWFVYKNGVEVYNSAGFGARH
jgi:hypothetical protein